MVLFSRLPLLARKQLIQSVRRSHGPTYKGQNLPFDVSNHRLLAIKMTIFFAIPFCLPFIVVRYQLKKSSGQYQ